MNDTHEDRGLIVQREMLLRDLALFRVTVESTGLPDKDHWIAQLDRMKVEVEEWK